MRDDPSAGLSLIVVRVRDAQRPKLSDAGGKACRWQPWRDAAVRCSAWLGVAVILNLVEVAP